MAQFDVYSTSVQNIISWIHSIRDFLWVTLLCGKIRMFV